ncbi:MAG: hypothetical protein LBJ43_01155 [Propionibacteriaceae bacterium]|jgi:hypothetical protein|nr:hypothetical protein [Propionibacteriaceae bacterium]
MGTSLGNVVYQPEKYSNLQSISWVDSTPFRVLLRHTIATTELPWYTMPSATQTPYRMIRALLFGSAGQPIRRIRYLDARNLLYNTVATITINAAALVNVTGEFTKLPQLLASFTAVELMNQVGIEAQWAVGLTEGWLVRCPRHVVWRIIGYAEMQESALLAQQPPPNSAARFTIASQLAKAA